MTKVLLTWSVVMALSLFAPAQGVGPAGAIFWSAAHLKGLEKSLGSKLDETKGGNEQLMTQKTHNTLFFHREGSGVPEIHEKLADFMVVRSGEGAMLVGGKLIDGKPSGPNEIRGKSIEGGTTYKLSAGDVLYIPANTPHRTLVEPGKQLNVMVIKVQP